MSMVKLENVFLKQYYIFKEKHISYAIRCAILKINTVFFAVITFQGKVFLRRRKLSFLPITLYLFVTKVN